MLNLLFVPVKDPEIADSDVVALRAPVGDDASSSPSNRRVATLIERRARMSSARRSLAAITTYSMTMTASSMLLRGAEARALDWSSICGFGWAAEQRPELFSQRGAQVLVVLVQIEKNDHSTHVSTSSITWNADPGRCMLRGLGLHMAADAQLSGTVPVSPRGPDGNSRPINYAVFRNVMADGETANAPRLEYGMHLDIVNLQFHDVKYDSRTTHGVAKTHMCRKNAGAGNFFGGTNSDAPFFVGEASPASANAPTIPSATEVRTEVIKAQGRWGGHGAFGDSYMQSVDFEAAAELSGCAPGRRPYFNPELQVALDSTSKSYQMLIDLDFKPSIPWCVDLDPFARIGGNGPHSDDYIFEDFDRETVQWAKYFNALTPFMWASTYLAHPDAEIWTVLEPFKDPRYKDFAEQFIDDLRSCNAKKLVEAEAAMTRAQQEDGRVKAVALQRNTDEIRRLNDEMEVLRQGVGHLAMLCSGIYSAYPSTYSWPPANPKLPDYPAPYI